ncbi:MULTISPECIES: uroporphyrinogen-III synthase [Bacillus]|uniref:uroporphyrinogen-III synthase n=1 Tax=Bacillus TaxID=1386 RepID=UPI000994B0A9|nr:MULTISPECIES: uroporphyrinogen-III synthase [Bacillus cereus group]MBJ8018886.1 uroporphyrinogen-III synthase [Bacillus cereus group sp. N34]OOR34985.1 uroporphyrinogen-III synthase [Bacillus mycoides]QWH52621.1 uroporphyrinogen-III synthase [Bacillus mycoides]QWI99630.1 uroporphyrinogen-III synthase [Bacillus mycoides]HDR7632392.1 uroporphyrinogen-III synthase [Bacillus mycoides]
MNALAGKTVLITRAQHQAKQMSVAVKERSGIPLEIPLLRMEGTSHRQIQHIAGQLHSYDWVIFTSKNGVAFFLDSLRKKLPGLIKIAAVGVKTKLELEKRGYQVEFVPTAFVAETFAEEFLKELSGNERILFPKGNLARDVIPVKLREFGVFLDELIVYGTKVNVEKKQELITALKLGEVNIITFTSPSTVDSFVRLLEGTNWREWTKKCTIACIGPITEKEANLYFPHVIVPKEYTVEALLQCICESIK